MTMEWQTIATAPEWGGETICAIIYVQQYNAVGEAELREDGWWWANTKREDSETIPLAQISHWIPLPLSPRFAL